MYSGESCCASPIDRLPPILEARVPYLHEARRVERVELSRTSEEEWHESHGTAPHIAERSIWLETAATWEEVDQEERTRRIDGVM
jgi:hypothetical protein